MLWENASINGINIEKTEDQERTLSHKAGSIRSSWVVSFGWLIRS